METWKCETNKSKINASENCVEKITPGNTMDFDPRKTSLESEKILRDNQKHTD